MSTDPVGLSAPLVAPPERSRGVAFWLGLVVLAAGFVVAAIGVTGAVASFQRAQVLGNYAEASTKARFVADRGVDVVVRGQLLLDVSRSEADAGPEMRQLLLDRDDLTFNLRSSTLNLEATLRAELLADLTTFDEHVREALARDGAITWTP